MYDSRTDRPVYPGRHTGGHARRHDYKREALFVGWNTFGVTARMAHQAPAPDDEFGTEPLPVSAFEVMRPGKTARDKARKALGKRGCKGGYHPNTYSYVTATGRFEITRCSECHTHLDTWDFEAEAWARTLSF